jgi:hypothetical protein
MSFENMMNGMFGKIEPGLCRLSVNGEIAVKTGGGYKSYNVKTGRLTNCSNFAFDIGSEMFFVIPTNKVAVGDIILAPSRGGKRVPKCVVNVEKNAITVVNYEDSVQEIMIPERYVFMGNTYFYGKIVSIFGNSFKSGKKGKNNMMKYWMMSQMFKGESNPMKSFTGAGSGDSNNMMSTMMLMSMMGGNGFGEMFDGMFDFDDSDEDEDDSEDVGADVTGEEEK